MGVYGFTRGWRSQRSGEEPRLLYHKCFSGMANGLFYAYPLVNLLTLASLIGRLEVKARGLDPTKYDDCYREMDGECTDTI